MLQVILWIFYRVQEVIEILKDCEMLHMTDKIGVLALTQDEQYGLLIRIRPILRRINSLKNSVMKKITSVNIGR